MTVGGPVVQCFGPQDHHRLTRATRADLADAALGGGPERLLRRRALRTLLSEQLERHPDQLPLQRDAFSRVYLEGRPDLHLSVASRQGWIICACSLGKIGVDVEFADLADDPALHPMMIPCPELDFTHRWTASEAVGKALGFGLEAPLVRSVAQLDGSGALLVMLDQQAWRVEFRQQETMVFAVAVETPR